MLFLKFIFSYCLNNYTGSICLLLSCIVLNASCLSGEGFRDSRTISLRESTNGKKTSEKRNGMANTEKRIVNHNFSVPITSSEYVGYTPLNDAIYEGNTKRVLSLIKNGADVNYVSQGMCGQDTPLMMAIFTGNKSMVELLINKGADVNHILKKDVFNTSTPLIEAISLNNKKIVELLIDKGADVNQEVRYGLGMDTTLCSAIRSNNKGIVELLINKGANVNQEYKGAFGGIHTALHDAIFSEEISGNKDILKLLINKGARVDHSNEEEINRILGRSNSPSLEIML